MIRPSLLVASDRWNRPSSAPLDKPKRDPRDANSSRDGAGTAWSSQIPRQVESRLSTNDAASEHAARPAATDHHPQLWSTAHRPDRAEPRLAGSRPLTPVAIKDRSRKLKFIESGRMQLLLRNRPAVAPSSPDYLRSILQEQSFAASSSSKTYGGDGSRPGSAMSSVAIAVDASTPALAPRQVSTCSFEAALLHDLSKVAATDDYRTLNAHRLAFSRYIEAQDAATQAFLTRVLLAYENVQVHKFQTSFDEVTERLHAAELVARQAINERNLLQARVEGLNLSILNLEKQLNSRTEMISQISHQFRINTAALNWMTGETTGNPILSSVEAAEAAEQQKKSKTMAEIRSVQQRVTLTHNEAMRQSAKDSRREGASGGGAASMFVEEDEVPETLQAYAQLDEIIAAGGVDAFHGVPQHRADSAAGFGAAAGAGGKKRVLTVSELYVLSGQDEHISLELLASEDVGTQSMAAAGGASLASPTGAFQQMRR